ncbi:MAG TPA: hypothetical protein ACQGQH_04220 [Xylella sp.]
MKCFGDDPIGQCVRITGLLRLCLEQDCLDAQAAVVDVSSVREDRAGIGAIVIWPCFDK